MHLKQVSIQTIVGGIKRSIRAIIPQESERCRVGCSPLLARIAADKGLHHILLAGPLDVAILQPPKLVVGIAHRAGHAEPGFVGGFLPQVARLPV